MIVIMMLMVGMPIVAAGRAASIARPWPLPLLLLLVVVVVLLLRVPPAHRFPPPARRWLPAACTYCCCSVLVTGLPPDVSRDELRNHFGSLYNLHSPDWTYEAGEWWSWWW